jgi:hypothetical protein
MKDLDLVCMLTGFLLSSGALMESAPANAPDELNVSIPIAVSKAIQILAEARRQIGGADQTPAELGKDLIRLVNRAMTQAINEGGDLVPAAASALGLR